MPAINEPSDEHTWRLGSDTLRAWCVRCGQRAPVHVEDVLMDWRSALIRGGVCNAPSPALVAHA